MALEVNIVGDLSRLALKPGDRLVFSTEQRLYPEAIAHIKEELERIAPGHEIIILADGCKIEVLEPA